MDATFNNITVTTSVGRVWIKWGKGGEFRQILKKRLYLLSKGYTCRFKSEAFASFASIALRPWLRVYRIGKFLLKLRPMEKTIDLTQIIITLYYCNLHELLSSTPCYLQVRIKLTTLPMMSIITCLVIVSEGIMVSAKQSLKIPRGVIRGHRSKRSSQ